MKKEEKIFKENYMKIINEGMDEFWSISSYDHGDKSDFMEFLDYLADKYIRNKKIDVDIKKEPEKCPDCGAKRTKKVINGSGEFIEGIVEDMTFDRYACPVCGRTTDINQRH